MDSYRQIDDLLNSLDQEREELANLVLHLSNIYGPVGREIEPAQEINAWYERNNIKSQLIEITNDRANVVAQLAGSGTGKTLLFNAHLDTEASGPDFDNLMQIPDPNTVGAWRENDRIYGHTALNDRHAHALFMLAARAVQRSDIPLTGDVILTSVAGETGQAPVDEYQGVKYEGKGFGTNHLLQQGVKADFALVSETSSFALNWHHCGANYYKVTVRGENMYTPRLKRGNDLESEPNAVLKAAHVVTAIEKWAVDYTAQHSGQTACGPVAPQALVGAIRGGIPWRPNRSAPYCAMYVDVRTLPEADSDEITQSLQRAVDEVGVGAEVELIMSRRGAVGKGIEPLADAIRDAYGRVRGGSRPPHEGDLEDVSMWRDTNIFNNAGIPAINFGPGRGRADVQGRGYLHLDDLLDTTKMYALIILSLCTASVSSEVTHLSGVD